MLKTVGFPSTRTGDQTIVDGNLVIGTSGKGITGAFYQKVATAALPASATSTLTVTTAGKMAQFQITADVGGSGAGSLIVNLAGLLSNANYYQLVEVGKFSYLSITMNSATKGNGLFTVSIVNALGSAGTVTVMGIGDGDFSIAVA